MTSKYKYYMKTINQGHDSIHENSEEKKRLQVRVCPFLANFSWVGLALG